MHVVLSWKYFQTVLTYACCCFSDWSIKLPEYKRCDKGHRHLCELIISDKQSFNAVFLVGVPGHSKVCHHVHHSPVQRYTSSRWVKERKKKKNSSVFYLLCLLNNCSQFKFLSVSLFLFDFFFSFQRKRLSQWIFTSMVLRMWPLCSSTCLLQSSFMPWYKNIFSMWVTLPSLPFGTHHTDSYFFPVWTSVYFLGQIHPNLSASAFFFCYKNK